MTTFESCIQHRGAAPFPAFTGERVYMRAFTKSEGLPTYLARWQPTVDAMLAGVDATGPIYIMIDQSPVRAGNAQRRPGLHVDGYWHPAIHAHGSSPGRHSSLPARHRSTPPGRHSTAHFSAPEALILASDVEASRGFAGVFDGIPGDGGDCQHIETTGLRETRLRAGQVYAGNVTMLHESLPVASDCLRTLVRLNVPGWTV